MSITVTLYADSNGTHLNQIYTGLYLLSRDGVINLKLRPGTALTKARMNRQFLGMSIDHVGGTFKVIFDMTDHQIIGIPEALEYCDVYFKRSLTSTSYDGLKGHEIQKIAPFGFFYRVIAQNKMFLMKRLLIEFLSRPYNPFSKRNRFHLHHIKELVDACMDSKVSPLFSVEELYPKPVEHDIDVLFQCRLWDPSELVPHNRSDAEKVNEDRISIIRKLKSELGQRFVGGLQPTAFAKKTAPDLVIDDPSMSQRRNFIALVERSRIVVSSTGLLGSNGGKLGEYIALGKAIISEKIVTDLPVKFEEGIHYESYCTPSECLQKAITLLSDQQRQRALEAAVADYYWSYLSPKELMWHHIRSVVGKV